SGVDLDRTLECALRLGCRCRVVPRERVAAQHMVVSVQAGRGLAASALGSARLHAAHQGSDDRLHDLVLHREEICHRTIEALAPDMIAGLGIDELRGDPDAFTHPADAPLDEAATTHPEPEPLHVDGLALE